jgi:murein DD-endopeptidase MepM/ murein hydrolase activator NlpD
MHNGIDMAPTSHQPGTPVRAAADGKVTWSGFNTSMGNSVIIDHNTGFGTRYMHMSSNLTVHIGDQVKKGQVIGYMNTTGDSTGVHLHFEICGTIEGAKCTNQVNPRQALDFPPMGTLAKDYYDPSLDTSGK